MSKALQTQANLHRHDEVLMHWVHRFGRPAGQGLKQPAPFARYRSRLSALICRHFFFWTLRLPTQLHLPPLPEGHPSSPRMWWPRPDGGSGQLLSVRGLGLFLKTGEPAAQAVTQRAGLGEGPGHILTRLERVFAGIEIAQGRLGEQVQRDGIGLLAGNRIAQLVTQLL